ncbi:hypothetical protein [Cyanobium sp. WAJ14-Wanaka]|uniref:hypothetical protein n=1 Tax=Cyanobium sp. WAJ14-Wanaka TaxID=2823725 RepID=UPI0020CE5063|nr:hypothetical protein [Cyanobium sp. WAJ14-Wanaka]MCP9776167.1 hypothetical protein [Cyanobium sp. WAJ14-Wanaka]
MPSAWTYPERKTSFLALALALALALFTSNSLLIGFMVGDKSAEFDFSLDPSKYPKRIDLEVSDETMEYLTRRSQLSGRSVEEIILEIIDGQINS